MRGIRDYLPQELVDRFEQTGDIIYFVKICDKIRATLTLVSIIQSFAIKATHHSAQHLCPLFGGGSDAHRIPPPGQGQASEDMLLLVALCGPHLGSYVRHFGFCLKPVIQRVSVSSSASLIQLVRAASDLLFELSASLCSLLRRSEWAFLLWRDHL